jgi:hypothetical protein
VSRVAADLSDDELLAISRGGDAEPVVRGPGEDLH